MIITSLSHIKGLNDLLRDRYYYYFHAEDLQIEGKARPQWAGPITHLSRRLARPPSSQHFKLLQTGQSVGPDAAVGRTIGSVGVVPQRHHC